MVLLNLFSQNVDIQYKSYLLSKATIFTVVIAILNLVFPLIIALYSRGFWLESGHFYEQPLIRSTYDYLLIAGTDDPSYNIICGEARGFNSESIQHEEDCMETSILEQDYDKDGANDNIEYLFRVIIPKGRIIRNVILLMGLDFQIMTTCPLHMQSLGILNKEYGVHPNGFKYYGDIQFSQGFHLPCNPDTIDTRFNSSLFELKPEKGNIIEHILNTYLNREVITLIKPLFTTFQYDMGTMDINIILKISEMRITYITSFLQELKWAWPQYLSFLVLFYFIFNWIKTIVFRKRLLMAWKTVPWDKNT